MRYGRTLLAGLGWAGTLGGLALCVLIFLSAYLAFDDHGGSVKPRKDEIIRLPSVPDAEVPRVPLGRPPARIAGDRRRRGAAAVPMRPRAAAAEAAATPAPRPAPPVHHPRGDAAGADRRDPPPVAATPAPAATSPPPGSGRPQPPPTLGDTTREVVGAVGTEVGRVSPPVGQVVEDAGDTLGDTVDALNPPAARRDHAAQPAQRVTLQLGVVLNGAVVAARDDDELGARVGRAPRQLARVRHRDPLVALGVQEQQRDRQALDRRVERVLGQEGLDRGHVGGEVELAAAQAAPQPVRARGADRDHGARAERLGGEDREVAAHARPPHGERHVAEQARHRRDVLERPAVELAAAGAVAALVEADRRQPCGAGGARVVVVALLAGPGAVQDHHAGPRIALRQPQRVGQPVELAELGRGSGGLIAHNRRASWPPRR